MDAGRNWIDSWTVSNEEIFQRGIRMLPERWGSVAWRRCTLNKIHCSILHIIKLHKTLKLQKKDHTIVRSDSSGTRNWWGNRFCGVKVGY